MSKKVNVKEPLHPDKLHMEKDPAFPMAYAVEIPLDSAPDDIWIQCFEQEWKTSWYALKRDVTVKGDKLRAITAPEEIKGRIEWIKELVGATNRCVERYNQEMIRREQTEKAKKKQEEETIKEMREALKK